METEIWIKRKDCSEKDLLRNLKAVFIRQLISSWLNSKNSNEFTKKYIRMNNIAEGMSNWLPLHACFWLVCNFCELFFYVMNLV